MSKLNSKAWLIINALLLNNIPAVTKWAWVLLNKQSTAIYCNHIVHSLLFVCLFTLHDCPVQLVIEHYSEQLTTIKGTEIITHPWQKPTSDLKKKPTTKNFLRHWQTKLKLKHVGLWEHQRLGNFTKGPFEKLSFHTFQAMCSIALRPPPRKPSSWW